MVAQYALLIAEEANIACLGAVAGLLHNTDRLFSAMDEAETKSKLLEYLGKTNIGLPEKVRVVTAVLEHNKKNSPGDGPVTVCLKDADRLANISPFDIIARSARAFPDLPLVDPRYIDDIDPSSTYRKPGTVFRDAIQSSLEWEPWFRLPKARELAKRYFDGLRLVQQLTARQYAETGLNEYRRG